MTGPKVYPPVQNLSGEVEKPALLWKGRESLAADILNRAVAAVGSGVGLTSASHPQLNEDSLEGIEIEVIDRSVLPHDAAARKALPVFTFLTEYFPDAIVEMVKVSVAGNEQHNPGEPLHWARGKSTDQLDSAFRHIFERKVDGVRKDATGQYLLAQAAWRILAQLQLEIEEDRGFSRA